MNNSYSINCRTWKWTKKLLFHLFDLAVLNSYILFSSLRCKKISHSDFRNTLKGKLLVKYIQNYETLKLTSCVYALNFSTESVVYPGTLFGGGRGCSKNSVEDRENGDLGVVGPQSGVLKAVIIWYIKFISYTKFFLIFGNLRLFMMTTNLFFIANVKQILTQVGLEFYCHFFRRSWCVGVLNSAIFNSFHNRVEFGTILEGLRNFVGEGLNTPASPSPNTPIY